MVSLIFQETLTGSSPSRNSGESMPCGGGDIGLNVWVEEGALPKALAPNTGATGQNRRFLSGVSEVIR